MQRDVQEARKSVYKAVLKATGRPRVQEGRLSGSFSEQDNTFSAQNSTFCAQDSTLVQRDV